MKDQKANVSTHGQKKIRNTKKGYQNGIITLSETRRRSHRRKIAKTSRRKNRK